MNKALFRRLCSLALPMAVMVAAPAQASTVIDFEARGVPEVIQGATVYQQGGFVVSSPYDFSIIGYSNPDDPNAPTGNNSLYYNVLNGNVATIRRADGGLFDLLSFDAALLPTYIGYSDDGSEPLQVYGGEVLFNGDHTDYTTGLLSVELPGSSTGHYPFTHFANLGGILGYRGVPAFTNLKELRIFGCMYPSATGACDVFDDPQIALDNVEVQASVAAVPEPAAWALLGLGLCGMVLLQRRRGQSVRASLSSNASFHGDAA